MIKYEIKFCNGTSVIRFGDLKNVVADHEQGNIVSIIRKY